MGNTNQNTWKVEKETLLVLHPFSVMHFLWMINNHFKACEECSICGSERHAEITFDFDSVPFLVHQVNDDQQQMAKESNLKLTQIIKGKSCYFWKISAF